MEYDRPRTPRHKELEDVSLQDYRLAIMASGLAEGLFVEYDDAEDEEPTIYRSLDFDHPGPVAVWARSMDTENLGTVYEVALQYTSPTAEKTSVADHIIIAEKAWSVEVAARRSDELDDENVIYSVLAWLQHINDTVEK